MAVNPFSKKCNLCLLREIEVDPFLKTLQAPGLEIKTEPSLGSLQIIFSADYPVDDLIHKVQRKFPTFFIGDKKIEEAIHTEMIGRKKTLSIAESCTGGAMAARIVSIAGASLFFSGSIVTYSNAWKERFLNVRHDTLINHGAVSAETVREMAQGLFDETESDYAVAISGILGPKGEVTEKPIGTVFIAVAKRGEKMDVGRISVPQERGSGIEMTIQTALGALWRRLVHNTATFS